MSSAPQTDDVRLQATAASLAVEHVTVEVGAALKSRRVEFVVLKGPTQQRWLFPRGDVYATTDVDVFVCPSQIDRAETVLREIGFCALSLDQIKGDRPNHATPWEREGTPAHVDLHRTIVGARARPETVWRELAGHRVAVQLGQVQVPILDTVGQLLMLGLHAAQNGYRDDRTRRYLARGIEVSAVSEWYRVDELATRIEAREALATGLRLAGSGGNIADMLRLPDSQSLEAALRSASAPNVALAVEWLSNLPGPRAKFQFVARKVVPPRVFMRDWLPVAQRGRVGLSLAYLYRPLWLAWWAPRGYLAWRRAKKVAEASQRAAHD